MNEATRTGFRLVIETDGYEWPSEEENDAHGGWPKILVRDGCQGRFDLLAALEMACEAHAIVDVVRFECERGSLKVVETGRWKIK